MALARLKKMMGYAGGTDEIMRGCWCARGPSRRGSRGRSGAACSACPAAPNPWAGLAATTMSRLANGSVPVTWPAAQARRCGALLNCFRPERVPSDAAGSMYGRPVGAPRRAGGRASARGCCGPCRRRPGRAGEWPLPAAATPAQIARWGVGAPGSDHVGIGPGNAAPMYTPPPAHGEIREAHRLGPGEAPAMDYPSGPGSRRHARWTYAGRGIPLTAQIALMTKPAAEKSALDLYNGAQTERDTTIAAALKAAGGNASDPAFIRVAQQADAKLALTHHEILGGQQLNLMQMMNSGMLSNPGGYGFGQ